MQSQRSNTRFMIAAAEAGETLRIFGKNFTPSSQIIIQASDLTIYRLTPSKSDSNSDRSYYPAGSPSRNVQYVSWEFTLERASSPQQARLPIYALPSRRVRNANCPNLVGDGATDNTSRLQACLDWLAPSPGHQ